MSIIRHLVLTANEVTWNQGLPPLFLGEWCLLYSRREKWEKLNYRVIKHPWNNAEHLYRDYLYINSLYKRLIVDLVKILNSLHGVNESNKYWEILVGPWLGLFIQTVFERWLLLNEASDDHEVSSISLIKNYSDQIPLDMEDFSKKTTSDEWNGFIYPAIINNANIFNGSVSIEYLESSIKSKKNRPLFRNLIGAVKNVSIDFLTPFQKIIQRKNNYFLYSTYIPKYSLLKVYFSLKQVPAIWRSYTPNNKEPSLDRKFRTWKIPTLGLEGFEKFIHQIIPSQMPVVYLESYQNLRSQVRGIPWPKKPRSIFTSIGLWYDSIASAYIAEKVAAGARLVIGQHGGAYGLIKFLWAEDFELNVADTYISWGWDGGDGRVYPLGIFKKIPKVLEKIEKESK